MSPSPSQNPSLVITDVLISGIRKPPKDKDTYVLKFKLGRQKGISSRYDEGSCATWTGPIRIDILGNGADAEHDECLWIGLYVGDHTEIASLQVPIRTLNLRSAGWKKLSLDLVQTKTSFFTRNTLKDSSSIEVTISDGAVYDTVTSIALSSSSTSSLAGHSFQLRASQVLEAGSAAAGRDGGGGDVAAATSDLLDKVKGFGDMIDKVSELHPYAKCAWGVLSVAYQVIKLQKTRDAQVLELVTVLNSAYDFVQQSKPLRLIQSRERTLDRLVKETVECGYFLQSYLRDPDFASRALKHLMDDSDRKMIAFKTNIRNIRRELVELGSLDMEIGVVRIERKVDMLLADSLFKDMAYARGAQCDVYRTCSPSTRSDTLARVIEWVEGTEKDGTNILYLAGAPNSGKSTIANSLFAHFAALGRAASFCFSRSKPRDACLLFPTLTRDMSDSNANWHTALLSAISPRMAIRTTESIMEQFDKFILEPANAVATDGPILWVIDGLDEVDDREELLYAISKRFSELPGNIRVLVTSRFEVDIHTNFATRKHIRSVFLHEVNDGFARSVIAAYIGGRLDLCAISQDRPELREWIQFTPRLRDMREDMVFWAETACNMLCDPEDLRYSQDLFQAILSSETVDDLYVLALTAYFPALETKEAIRTYQLAMRLCIEPVSATEFSRLIDTNTELASTCERIVGIMRSLGRKLSYADDDFRAFIRDSKGNPTFHVPLHSKSLDLDDSTPQDPVSPNVPDNDSSSSMDRVYHILLRIHFPYQQNLHLTEFAMYRSAMAIALPLYPTKPANGPSTGEVPATSIDSHTFKTVSTLLVALCGEPGSPSHKDFCAYIQDKTRSGAYCVSPAVLWFEIVNAFAPEDIEPVPNIGRCLADISLALKQSRLPNWRTLISALSKMCGVYYRWACTALHSLNLFGILKPLTAPPGLDYVYALALDICFPDLIESDQNEDFKTYRSAMRLCLDPPSLVDMRRALEADGYVEGACDRIVTIMRLFSRKLNRPGDDFRSFICNPNRSQGFHVSPDPASSRNNTRVHNKRHAPWKSGGWDRVYHTALQINFPFNGNMHLQELDSYRSAMAFTLDFSDENGDCDYIEVLPAWNIDNEEAAANDAFSIIFGLFSNLYDESSLSMDDFVEYIRDPSRSSSIYSVTEEDSGPDLIFGCMEIMSRGLRFNICEFDIHSLTKVSSGSVERHVNRRVPLALRHACLNCLPDVSDSMEDETDRRVMRSRKDELQSLPVNWMAWLEVVYLSGNCGYVDDDVVSLKKWMSKEIGRQISELHQDVCDLADVHNAKFKSDEACLFSFLCELTGRIPQRYITGSSATLRDATGAPVPVTKKTRPQVSSRRRARDAESSDSNSD